MGVTFTGLGVPQPSSATGQPGISRLAAVIPLLEGEQLLGGNWKIRPTARLYFKSKWCAIVEHAPPDLDVVR